MRLMRLVFMSVSAVRHRIFLKDTKKKFQEPNSGTNLIGNLFFVIWNFYSKNLMFPFSASDIKERRNENANPIYPFAGPADSYVEL